MKNNQILIKTSFEQSKPIKAKLESSNPINAKISNASSGTTNYEMLSNKPSINEITLIGNKSFEDLGVNTMTNLEIKELFDRVFNKGGN